MGFPVYSLANLVARLSSVNAAEYPVAPNQSQLKLFKNDANPDENQTIDTFVEADYVGYADVPLTMGPATMNDQSLIVSRTNVCNFNAAGGIDTQLIYGVYITNVGEDEVIAAQRFDTPQLIGGVLPTAIAGVWRASEPLSTYGWVDIEA